MEIFELFIFTSFRKVWFLKFGNNRNFWTRKIFAKKVWKKVLILTKIVHQYWKFQKNKKFEILQKKQFLSQKTLFLGQKVRKVWKKFGNFGNCPIPNFLKITKKWHSTRTSKIAKNSSQLENWLKSLVKSSECRALIATWK